MIPLIIALIVTGAAAAVFAVIAIITILRNSRLEREKKKALLDVEAAIADKEHLKEENANLAEALEKTRLLYNKMLAENAGLKASQKDLEEINDDLIKGQAAMRAQLAEQRRTVPIKRVRKTDTQATEP